MARHFWTEKLSAKLIHPKKNHGVCIDRECWLNNRFQYVILKKYLNLDSLVTKALKEYKKDVTGN